MADTFGSGPQVFLAGRSWAEHQTPLELPVTEDGLNIETRLDELSRRLDEVLHVIKDLASRAQKKEWYSTAELARQLCRAEFTVREWCRLKRINAEKRRTGRGKSSEWVISHTELLRIEREGLLSPAHCS